MLQFEPKRLKIQLVNIMKSKDLFQQALGNIYTEEYYKQNKSDFGNFLFIFQAYNSQDKKWSIIKKIQQIIQMIEKVSKKLQINNIDIIKLSQTNQQITIDIKSKLIKSIINQICQHSQVQTCKEFLNFIEERKDSTYKEFKMYKKSGGRFRENSCCKLGAIFRSWKIRTVSINQKGISYSNKRKQIKQYLAFDSGFSFYYGLSDTQSQYGIILVCNHRRLILQAQNIYDFILFLYLLRLTIKQCPYMNLNRFNSFSPIRYWNNVKYYIDGKNYFQALSVAISQAQISIFMIGWMFSPEFILKRGIISVNLKQALYNAAQRGVNISIIVYYESTFLPNDSSYLKEQLQAQHENIRVLRHPNYNLPALWSHHAKMVIIDQKTGFSGGLDLCYGRFDDQNHALFEHNPQLKLYPGIQYNNLRIKDITNVRNYMLEHLDRHLPRLPWHDVGQQIQGELVSDMSHHFIQFWNFASYENNRIHTGIKQQKGDNNNIFVNRIEDEQKQQNIVLSMVKLGIQNVKRKGAQSIDKIKQIASNYKNPKKINLKIQNESKTTNFVNYIQTVKQQSQCIKQTQQNQNKIQSILKNSLLISSKIHSNIIVEECLQKIKQSYLNNDQSEKMEEMSEQNEQFNEQNSQEQQDFIIEKSKFNPEIGQNQCQMVRSASNWSLGLHHKNREFSIHIAYIQLIAQAKYYIYIENQFFISSLVQQTVKNQVADALFMRISQAIKMQQQFKVYIMIPLLPGFAGDLQKQQCKILRTIMEWQYKTIYYSNNSLLKKLSNVTKNPQKYIKFFSLRTHDRYDLKSQPVTQIIYIHSKLMIVDDQYIILGSANINDRSLLGNRDSQIAIVSTGPNDSTGIMNGCKCSVWSGAQQLRIQLWKQHFSLVDEVFDPICYKTWDKICSRAESNTNLYRIIFGCYPDDFIEDRKNIICLKNQRKIQEYQVLKNDIKGNVVLFPYKFLCKDPVENTITNVQYYIPEQILT